MGWWLCDQNCICSPYVKWNQVIYFWNFDRLKTQRSEQPKFEALFKHWWHISLKKMLTFYMFFTLSNISHQFRVCFPHLHIEMFCVVIVILLIFMVRPCVSVCLCVCVITKPMNTWARTWMSLLRCCSTVCVWNHSETVCEGVGVCVGYYMDVDGLFFFLCVCNLFTCFRSDCNAFSACVSVNPCRRS